MKYLGEKAMPDPRTGVPGPFDLLEFECRRCDLRGLLGAPILRKEWPFQCPGCSRKYTHWRPVDGAGVPDLVPMVDLYERSGRPKPVPRLDFPGYVPTNRRRSPWTHGSLIRARSDCPLVAP